AHGEDACAGDVFGKGVGLLARLCSAKREAGAVGRLEDGCVEARDIGGGVVARLRLANGDDEEAAAAHLPGLAARQISAIVGEMFVVALNEVFLALLDLVERGDQVGVFVVQLGDALQILLRVECVEEPGFLFAGKRFDGEVVMREMQSLASSPGVFFHCAVFGVVAGLQEFTVDLEDPGSSGLAWLGHGERKYEQTRHATPAGEIENGAVRVHSWAPLSSCSGRSADVMRLSWPRTASAEKPARSRER